MPHVHVCSDGFFIVTDAQMVPVRYWIYQQSKSGMTPTELFSTLHDYRVEVAAGTNVSHLITELQAHALLATGYGSHCDLTAIHTEVGRAALNYKYAPFVIQSDALPHEEPRNWARIAYSEIRLRDTTLSFGALCHAVLGTNQSLAA